MNLRKFYKILINAILTILFLLALYYLGSLYTPLKYLERIDNIWDGLLSLFIFITIVVLSFIFIKYWMNFRKISKNKKIILIVVSAILLIYTISPLIVNDYCHKASDCTLIDTKCCPSPVTQWYDREAKNKRYQVWLDMIKEIKCFRAQCPMYKMMGMEMIIGTPSIERELVCASNRCQLIFDCEEVCQRFNSVDEAKKDMLKDYFSGLFIDKCMCE